MTTQVIFKIDPVLKKRAHKKAQAEGFTYSEMLQSATRAYVEGKYQMAGFVPSDWEPVGITRPCRPILFLIKRRTSRCGTPKNLWRLSFHTRLPCVFSLFLLVSRPISTNSTSHCRQNTFRGEQESHGFLQVVHKSFKEALHGHLDVSPVSSVFRLF